MIRLQKITQPDTLGATASTLCIAHCLATPLLFIASASYSTESPTWWKVIDLVFLGISFFAILQTSRTTTKAWIGNALYVSWGILTAAILNEIFEVVHLPELAVYIPAIALISLHIYNQRYCKCVGDNCCSNS
ncbi:MerC domain-containing protein [Reichenbachiella versicolor]|uniref:MerC domain-containing protein n=1 Tax=Reichenbachiella versicolor TaxID=1821036 RepID=UPI000D6DD646|nr:MerC domain-containing protein [Reichenbachiella versicolor]